MSPFPSVPPGHCILDGEVVPLPPPPTLFERLMGKATRNVQTRRGTYGERGYLASVDSGGSLDDVSVEISGGMTGATRVWVGHHAFGVGDTSSHGDRVVFDISATQYGRPVVTAWRETTRHRTTVRGEDLDVTVTRLANGWRLTARPTS